MLAATLPRWNPMFRTRVVLSFLLIALLAACGAEPAPAAPETAAGDEAPIVVSPPAWDACRIPGLVLPVPARLFVIDAATPDPDVEPGRETIRRVDVLVPGPVALLLTAPEATAWLVRPGPETEVRAIIALGDQPQRITGQRLGGHRLAAAASLGQACAGYLLADGPGPALTDAAEALFGKPHDALYRMQIGSVVIGGTEPGIDQPVDGGAKP